ncbi:hypothetical protein E4U54_006630 [Claviceps lovelessii]|nr:hypothetical protein E4U54_006630 [Claviceps lovelessii]
MAVGILEEIKQLSGRTHTRTDGFDGGPIQLRYPGVLRQTGCQAPRADAFAEHEVVPAARHPEPPSRPTLRLPRASLHRLSAGFAQDLPAMQPRVQLQVQLRSPRKPRTPDWAYKDLHPASDAERSTSNAQVGSSRPMAAGSLQSCATPVKSESIALYLVTTA